jgi:hypothetical protein
MCPSVQTINDALEKSITGLEITRIVGDGSVSHAHDISHSNDCPLRRQPPVCLHHKADTVFVKYFVDASLNFIGEIGQMIFTPEFAVRLRKDLVRRGFMTRGTLSREHNPPVGGNERALDTDLILTSVGCANSCYQEQDEYIDEWGIGWRSVPCDISWRTSGPWSTR